MTRKREGRGIRCGVAVGGTNSDMVGSQSLRGGLRAHTKEFLLVNLLDGGIFKEE